MQLTVKRRTLIRIVCFVLAIVAVTTAFAVIGMRQSEQAKRSLEFHYMKSIDDLITHTQNINTDLSKVLYVKSPALLAHMSSKLWREAGFAKDLVASLPIEYTKLQNTTKLLSQVGDYCVSLSRSLEKGVPITKEQRDTLASLGKYCDTMTREVITIADGVRTGSLSLEKVKAVANDQQDIGAANIAEGFTEFEEGFTAYPTLIYDGPFSDHIMQREPERLKGEPEVSREVARKKAAMAAGVAEKDIKDGEDEKSKMECFGFYQEGVTASVTKKGGLVASMLKSRSVTDTKLSVEQAMEHAKAYLKKLGVTDMESTYYEIDNNIITLNYAYVADGVMMYTDLIKVSVALDNGDITSFDARGYIVNHKQRELSFGDINAARNSVSEFLTIESNKPCVIPSGGLEEIACFEFKCKSEDGKDILVYINAETFAEEQILMLLVSENGTLTL